MSLTVGVLIIGSLKWDPGRASWRESRLQMTDSLPVTAPIRYGRKSASRANTYTMVFSRGCPAGQAVVVPCVSTVSSVEDLLAEAEHLWAAERSRETRAQVLSASWGCITLLPNPGAAVPQNILDGWAERIRSEPAYGNVPQTEGEGQLVSHAGILQIAWPGVLTEGDKGLPDLLLATATHPTLQGSPGDYPSVEMIAHAWNADTDNHVEYFRQNAAHGIRTFQDDAICGQLL
jgi:hypothetical protein